MTPTPTRRDDPREQATASEGVRWGVFATIVALAIGYIIVRDTDIQWAGFAAMLGFYALFYYIGAVTAGRRSDTLADTMVAGRMLPLSIAVLTMTATWVGGGYIAGTAESVFSSGLAWAQAPWGYALSLVVGGIFFAPKMRRGEFMTMIDPIDIRFGKHTAGVLDHPDWGAVYWNWWDFALLLVFGGIPWQVYFQRVLSAKDERTARWLSIGAGGLAIVAAIPAVLIGVVGFNADWAAVGAPEMDNPALVLPYVLRYLSPPVLGAIGLGAIAAAVMSSVDSSILSASSMGGWNVYRRMVRPGATDDQVKRVIQRLIVIVGVAATIMALNVQSVYELWYLCSDFVYVMLFPQLTCAMFARHANRWGAIAGLVVAVVLRFGGGEPVLGLPMWLPYPWVEDGVSLFPFRTLAMVASLLTILAVSYLTRDRCPPVPLEMLEPQHREHHRVRPATAG